MNPNSTFAPLLTRDEERDLAARIAAAREARARAAAGTPRPGDEVVVRRGTAARNRFIEANLRLVLSIARRRRLPAHVELDDVIQDGMLGLEKAVERYDHQKGFRFSTYATWWIRQSMQRGLEQHATTIRVPEHQRARLRTALRERADHGLALDDELARIESLTTPDSLDRPIDDDQTTLGAVVAVADDDPADSIEELAARATVDTLLADLDPQVADAVARRFGLRGHEPTTYRVIADTQGRSEESVRRQVARTLERLRPRARELAA